MSKYRYRTPLYGTEIPKGLKVFSIEAMTLSDGKLLWGDNPSEEGNYYQHIMNIYDFDARVVEKCRDGSNGVPMLIKLLWDKQ